MHDEEVDLALVRAAVLQQVLQLRPVGSLGTLALFLESFEDFVPFTLAVLLARTELRRQTEILRLFLRAHANVDYRADHWSQLSAIVGWRQGDRYFHDSTQSCAAHCSRNTPMMTCAIASA